MERLDLDHRSVDELEQIITCCESSITRLRVIQMAAIRRLDRLQAPLSDGCRSLGEWVAGRLDVSPDTAKTLVSTTRRLESCPTVEQAAGDGELSFDRTVAVARLAAAAGDEAGVLAASAGMDVAAIHRHVSQRRRLTAGEERERFGERYCATQFNLDHTGLRFHGEVFGVAARHVDAALHRVGDQLPDGPEAGSRATRNADALWKLCQDALDDSNEEDGAANCPQVTVFVDATTAVATTGETGLTIEAGPRVGPNVLEAVICDSVVEITATTGDGTPVNLGRRSRVVAPQLRRFVLHRDSGTCTAEGCVSRYRLQVHHIIPWSHGGATDADNLTTLCWFHHHVVVHGNGHRIDPASPPQRRRFLPPQERSHDPP